MSTHVYWLVDVSFRPENSQAFRVLAEEIAKVSDEEPGCTAYECNFDAEGTGCRIFEAFKDSPSVVTHVETFGAKYAERFMALCEVNSITLMGHPDQTVKDTMSGFAPLIFEGEGGFFGP